MSAANMQGPGWMGHHHCPKCGVEVNPHYPHVCNQENLARHSADKGMLAMIEEFQKEVNARLEELKIALLR